MNKYCLDLFIVKVVNVCILTWPVDHTCAALFVYLFFFYVSVLVILVFDLWAQSASSAEMGSDWVPDHLTTTQNRSGLRLPAWVDVVWCCSFVGRRDWDESTCTGRPRKTGCGPSRTRNRSWRAPLKVGRRAAAVLPSPVGRQRKVTPGLTQTVSAFSPPSAENRLLPSEVRKDALELQKLLEFDDEGAEGRWCYYLLGTASSLLALFASCGSVASCLRRCQLPHGRWVQVGGSRRP